MDSPRRRVRGDAAAATWIVRGGKSAAAPRPRRGYFAEESRSDAAATTWIVRGGESTRLRRERSVETRTFRRARRARVRYYRLTDIVRATVAYGTLKDMYAGLEKAVGDFGDKVREFNDRYDAAERNGMGRRS